jgi:uncharacterized membrane protein YwzB
MKGVMMVTRTTLTLVQTILITVVTANLRLAVMVWYRSVSRHVMMVTKPTQTDVLMILTTVVLAKPHDVAMALSRLTLRDAMTGTV